MALRLKGAAIWQCLLPETFARQSRNNKALKFGLTFFFHAHDLSVITVYTEWSGGVDMLDSGRRFIYAPFNINLLQINPSKHKWTGLKLQWKICFSSRALFLSRLRAVFYSDCISHAEQIPVMSGKQSLRTL